MIVGVSLFIGLSLPAYFQQYQPETAFILPGYFIPYSAASDGPIHSGNKQVCSFFLLFSGFDDNLFDQANANLRMYPWKIMKIDTDF